MLGRGLLRNNYTLPSKRLYPRAAGADSMRPERSPPRLSHAGNHPCLLLQLFCAAGVGCRMWTCLRSSCCRWCLWEWNCSSTVNLPALQKSSFFLLPSSLHPLCYPAKHLNFPALLKQSTLKHDHKALTLKQWWILMEKDKERHPDSSPSLFLPPIPTSLPPRSSEAAMRRNVFIKEVCPLKLKDMGSKW